MVVIPLKLKHMGGCALLCAPGRSCAAAAAAAAAAAGILLVIDPACDGLICGRLFQKCD